MIFSPSISEIREIFEAELSAAGGRVTDTFDDGRRLFLRGVLPNLIDVSAGDRVQAGVALRAVDEQVNVHPYTFRLVCSNGAIMAQAVQTATVELVAEGGLPWEQQEVCERLREAVRACAQPRVFQIASSHMRTAMESEADTLINLMPYLSRLPKAQVATLLEDILRRFGEGRDRSRYGLMNAVTARARDTKDPELRWRLEEIGGAIAARLRPPLRRRIGKAKLAIPA